MMPSKSTSLSTGSPLPEHREAEFVSVEEFARRIGVSKQSAHRAIDRDEVPGVFKLGRRVTINWHAFVATTYNLV